MRVVKSRSPLHWKKKCKIPITLSAHPISSYLSNHPSALFRQWEPIWGHKPTITKPLAVNPSAVNFGPHYVGSKELFDHSISPPKAHYLWRRKSRTTSLRCLTTTESLGISAGSRIVTQSLMGLLLWPRGFLFEVPKPIKLDGQWRRKGSK